jgi:predicted ATPase
LIYISTFKISDKKVTNPNIYPYNVFINKSEYFLIFDKITVFYGNNACGKSSLLNIIANKLKLSGKEDIKLKHGYPYFNRFVDDCEYELGENEKGQILYNIPINSRYIKSEDIMYEIKKIQQESILQDGYIYEYAKKGHSREEVDALKNSPEMKRQIERIEFSQEKYSNGETSLQLFDDWLQADALYLLDEPEVSLSPQNQLVLAEKINNGARFLNNQYIIATHSLFMLGTLDAKIYNLDRNDLDVCRWTELENVKYYYDFFKKHQEEFKD